MRSLSQLNLRLPNGIELFSIGGQKIFPLYAASGGIASGYAAYFMKIGGDGDAYRRGIVDLGRASDGIKDHGNGWKSICIEFSSFTNQDEIEKTSKKAIAKLETA